MNRNLLWGALLLALLATAPALAHDRYRRDRDRGHDRRRPPPPIIIERPVQPRVIITRDALVINPKRTYRPPVVIRSPHQPDRHYRRY